MMSPQGDGTAPALGLQRRAITRGNGMKVKELLSDESKWTKGRWARDATQMSVDFASPRAVCWCLGGAVARCYLETDFVWDKLREAISQVTGKPVNCISVVEFNDHSATFADIRRVLELADV